MQAQPHPDDFASPALHAVPANEAVVPAGDLSPLTFGVAVAGICLLGFLVRLGFVLSGDFPLHDGGLFFQMVRDLQHAHYALPAT